MPADKTNFNIRHYLPEKDLAALASMLAENEETLNIYRELGFEMLQQYIAYNKKLP